LQLLLLLYRPLKEEPLLIAGARVFLQRPDALLVTQPTVSNRVPVPALNSRPRKVLKFHKTENVLELFWKTSGRS